MAASNTKRVKIDMPYPIPRVTSKKPGVYHQFLGPLIIFIGLSLWNLIQKSGVRWSIEPSA